jgi:predicted regulator of Ras-like GTPase activity (Roadblock/LC7/MglB family)
MTRKSKQKTEAHLVVDEHEVFVIQEEDETFKDLGKKLVEIRKDQGIIGYIIRNKTSAAIDLNEPEKLVEYAIFSSQVFDAGREISTLFEIGDIRSIIIEGKENNVICMDIEGNKIAIFMEKSADYANILERVSP